MGLDRQTVIRSGYWNHNLTRSTVQTVQPKKAGLRGFKTIDHLIKQSSTYKSGLGIRVLISVLEPFAKTKKFQSSHHYSVQVLVIRLYQLIIGQIMSAAHWPNSVSCFLPTENQLLICQLTSAAQCPTIATFALANCCYLLIGCCCQLLNCQPISAAHIATQTNLISILNLSKFKIKLN